MLLSCFTSLASVNISDSVTSIGDCAFSDCNSLTALYVSAGNPAYCLLDGALFDKAQTTLIAYLGGRKGSYVIPNGVTSIGDYAFDSSTELTSVTIPDGVTSIGDYAFYYCYGLTSVTIPDSVTNIGKSAFFGCESLTSVNIPDSVTSIGAGAFAGCESLTALYVSAGNPAYSSLNGVLFDKAQTTLIAYPVGWQGSSYAIPDGVTSIGDYAFYYCYGLTSVTIPESVTSIGECAFATTELTEIKVMATMPPSIIADKWGLNEATFKKVRKSIPVYVPAESIEAYRTAEGWSEFTNFLPLEDKER